MAHEVIRTIGGRQYRYRVESYRDAASGRVRNRWTYVGAEGADASPMRRPRSTPEATREKLLQALERLLERADYEELTAGAIATEAGVAHGTFYRYFKDKADALRAAVVRIQESGEAFRAALAEPLPDRDAERARLRELIGARLREKLVSPRTLRAWHRLTMRDPELSAQRQERRRESIARFSAYLERCRSLGIAAIDDPDALAEALIFQLEGAFFRDALESNAMGDRVIDAVALTFERTIFG